MVITDDRSAPSDQPDLLSRARSGDPQSFSALIEPLHGRLLRQAVALTGDPNLAQDILSETLSEAWKSFPRYDGSCRLSTWLYAILLHRYQKSVRRAGSRPVALALLSLFQQQEIRDRHETLPSSEPSPSDVASQKETFAELRQCIERLPGKHAGVILLRFFEDASLPDMAAVLGCSVGTVKSRLHHALEKLRKMKMNPSAWKGDK